MLIDDLKKQFQQNELPIVFSYDGHLNITLWNGRRKFMRLKRPAFFRIYAMS